jgi:hypothetical protein
VCSANSPTSYRLVQCRPLPLNALVSPHITSFSLVFGSTVFCSQHTNGLALFVLLFLYLQSLLCLTFLLSSVLEGSRTAGFIASLLVFFMFLPQYPALDLTDWRALALSSLLSPTAFSLGLAAVLDAEDDGTGIGWRNVSGGRDTPQPFYLCVGWLVVDAVGYALVAWYVGQVWPARASASSATGAAAGAGGAGGAGGVISPAQPFYFCLNPCYWRRELCGDSSGSDCCCCCASASTREASHSTELDGGSNSDEHTLLHISLEERSAQLQARATALGGAAESVSRERSAAQGAVRIVALRKVFEDGSKLSRCVKDGSADSSSGGSGSGSEEPVVALDNVHLDIYEGQILALLGTSSTLKPCRHVLTASC